jgi:succinyl-diaminopimelate desuccinylase
VARTRLGRAERVVVAGHLDTVPLAGGDLPSRREGSGDGEELVGRGSVDMKGGVAVQLAAAAAVPEPVRDVTWVFYDHEEVDSALNGLGRLARNHPDWLAGDFAVLCEPTSAGIEGGCNGTLRAEVVVPGKAAHSARPWAGVNAVHAAADVLDRLVAYAPREAPVEGLVFREALNAVDIRGGVAGNVIPDQCVVTVNFRFAPDRDAAAAEAHVREVFAGHAVRITDVAAGARPGLDHPAAAAFLAAIARPPRAKLGWTDVARFSALGVPAVNYGPGDPLQAHTDGEACPVAEIRECARVLTAWLGGQAV